MANMLHHTNETVNVHKSMHISVSSVSKMGPVKTAEAVKQIEKENYWKYWNVKDKGARLHSHLENSPRALQVKHDNDIDVLALAVQAALPLAEEKFGSDLMQYHVFVVMIKELKGSRCDGDGKVSKGVRYLPDVLSYALTLLRDSNSQTYDSLKEVMFLPDCDYMQKKLSKEMGEDEDGPCYKVIQLMFEYWSRWAKHNPNSQELWLEQSNSLVQFHGNPKRTYVDYQE